MTKPATPNLRHVKPTARKRTALRAESLSRGKRLSHHTASISLLHTENTGILQPENDIEQTLKFRQSHLLPHLDLSTSSKANFKLDLQHSNLSPYTAALFSRSSRSLLVASRRGHVALTNWRNAHLHAELHLNETLRGATFLHNDAFFATAQKNAAYIYDSSGAQVHALRKHRDPGFISFLPHHLLLATASAPCAQHSNLVYTDVSTGEIISDIAFGSRAFKLNHVSSMAVNASNGVLHMAHSSGIVSLWSPVVPRPMARILTCAGGVRHVAVANNGRWMVTAGGDARVKVWDLRTYKMLDSWKIPALSTALAVSQRDLIALSFGATVQIWAPGASAAANPNAASWGGKPYMMETFSGKTVTALDFCPHEDVTAVCHEHGMQTMIVPGAGVATFDTRAPNPYETRKQRRENQVRSLLDKLPPASITLDPAFVGSIEKNAAARLREIQEVQRNANDLKRMKKMDVKKAKGKNKISKKLKRKQANVIDARRVRLQEMLEEERKTKEATKRIREKEAMAVRAGVEEGGMSEPQLPTALNRFVSKG